MKTPEKLNTKQGMIKDPVVKANYLKYSYATSCDDCTHFDFAAESCLFDFPTAPTRKSQQIIDLETLGKMAFCRAYEID